MTQGKVKAVIFIIIGILLVAILCSWLAGKDNSKVNPTPVIDTTAAGLDSLAATPEPADNAPVSGGSNAFYTSGGSNAYAGGNSSNNNTGNTANSSNNNTNNTGGSNAYANQPANNDANNTQGNPTTTTTGDASGNVGTQTQEPEQPTGEVTIEPDTPVEPTPTPYVEFIPRKLTSTSFQTERGMLTLHADVSVETYNETEVLVVVDLSVDSYSIYLYENAEGAGISVNGVFTTCNTPAISYPNNVRTNHKIGTAAFAMELTDGNTLTVPVAVEWYYNGKYGNEFIDVIECGGNLTISRN